MKAKPLTEKVLRGIAMAITAMEADDLDNYTPAQIDDLKAVGAWLSSVYQKRNSNRGKP